MRTSILLAAVWGATSAAAAEPAIRYDRDVLPIISARCFQCHGPDEESREANLRLDVRADATQQREGRWAIKPGNPAASELLRRVGSTDADVVMPPPGSAPPLSEAEIETLRRWIAAGAEYTKHWAFVPPQRPAVPAVDVPGAVVHNEIDRFVLDRLTRAGLKQSPPADPHTLLRRVSLDLVGLPPTPDEIERFVTSKPSALPAGPTPKPSAWGNAYSATVDRLLASPAYGERWARPWLDLARYADSAGYGSDPLRLNIWPYRDWVIDALNANMPYDQFTLEQLAGDLLPGATESQRIATAFHRNTMTNTEGGTDDEEFRVAAVKDRIATTMQVWMGLTMGCAQCHSHKFDPLTQREYYQFFAIFNQTEDFDQPDERPTLPLYLPEQQQKRDALTAEIAALKQTLNEPNEKLTAELAEWEQATRDPKHWHVVETGSGATARELELDPRSDGWWQISGVARPDEAYLFKAKEAVPGRPTPGNYNEILRLRELGPGDFASVAAFRIELALADEANRNQAKTAKVGIDELRLYSRPVDVPKARYVRIELPGKPRILSLAEVQVFSDGKNVARSGTATQSSTDYGGDPQRAIDGNTDGEYKQNSTTHTRNEENPWWEVDLGSALPLDAVVVWNRTDAGVSTRLTRFKVIALDADRKIVSEQTVAQPPQPRAVLPWGAREVNLSRITTSDGSSATNAIDGKANSLWNVALQADQLVAAVVELAKPEPAEKVVEWLLVVEPGSKDAASLGRFRWSLTSRRKPVAVPSPAAQAILDTPVEKRTPQQTAQLAAFFRPLAPSLAKPTAQLARLEKELADIKPTTLPVMVELPKEKQRKSFMLTKGNFLIRGDEVSAALPTSFNAPPDDVPIDRLAVARWIVDRNNPLTARVAVNRLWAQLFGTGLVETEEDFGTQGQQPSHPELLDWLAVEFMESGWDTKHMLRLMVGSATYQQASLVTADGQRRDARNRLLWRYPRRRLDAEGVRDQALSIAGLLSRKMHGPSVYPPQPDGLWRAAFNGQRTWATSTGEDRYRRGIYVFWRRTVPYPSMVTFDAPSRENCTMRRLPTNTPLQALVTLNDPAYVEMAQALARRLMTEGGASATDRVRWGLQLALCRPADERQVQVLARLYEQSLEHYRSNSAEAAKMATEPLGKLPAEVDVAEAAAWTVVANVLLNLDGVLTKG